MQSHYYFSTCQRLPRPIQVQPPCQPEKSDLRGRTDLSLGVPRCLRMTGLCGALWGLALPFTPKIISRVPRPCLSVLWRGRAESLTSLTNLPPTLAFQAKEIGVRSAHIPQLCLNYLTPYYLGASVHTTLYSEY